MYDHFDDPHYHQNYSKMASYYSKNFPEIDSLEPWGKTNQLIIRNIEKQRKHLKTFYKTYNHQSKQPKQRTIDFSDKKSITQRIFGFYVNPQQQKNKVLRQIRTRQASRQEKRLKEKKIIKQLSVNSYNFNQQIQLSQAKLEERKFTNTIFNIKNYKINKQKTSLQTKPSYQMTPKVSISAIKQRVGINNHRESVHEQYVCVGLENQEDKSIEKNKNLIKERKKSKIIAVGFQKFSKIRGLFKQKSNSVQFDNSFALN